MPATQYCLQENILSIEEHSGAERECLYVPAGTVVSVLGNPGNDRFVEVEWNTKRLRMFDIDLRERAKPIPDCESD